MANIINKYSYLLFSLNQATNWHFIICIFFPSVIMKQRLVWYGNGCQRMCFLAIRPGPKKQVVPEWDDIRKNLNGIATSRDGLKSESGMEKERTQLR